MGEPREPGGGRPHGGARSEGGSSPDARPDGGQPGADPPAGPEFVGPAPLLEEIRALPRAAWILYAETFVNRFGTFVLVFLALYLTRIGWSPGRVGIAVGMYGGGALAASMAGGWLADHVGRRNTIALSMFASAVSMVLLWRADGVAAILALSFCAGLSAESYRPAAAGLLTDLTPAGRRTSAFALYRLAINLGAAAGPAVGGLLAERSFAWIFLGDAATSTIAGVVTLAALPEGRRVRHEDAGQPGLVAALRADPSFLFFLGGSFLALLVFFQAFSSLPLHVEDLGFRAFDYGLLMSLNGLLVVTCELPIVSVTRRLPTRRVIAAGLVVTGLGFGAIAGAATLPLLAGCVAVFTLGEMIFAPVSSAYVGDVAPDHLRGRWFGAWSTVNSVAMLVGPAIGTALWARSPTALWLGCAGVAALGAALVTRAPPARS